MMARTRTLVLASRGSTLALHQAHTIGELLRTAHEGVETEILVVKTKGDTDKRPFSEIGGKGLFTSEVERAVLERRADVAVHSAKDLTAEIADGCVLVCIPRRAGSEDVVVGSSGAEGGERLASLAQGARVGTSSMRRRALLAEARPDLDAVALRGNLDTRLRKVADGAVDAAILARAGIDRLVEAGRAAVDYGRLDPGWWIPPPGLGALAMEALEERDDLKELFAPLDDPAARAEVFCERSFGARLEGGCSVPLGCSASVDGDRLVATGYLGLTDGSRSVRDRISGAPREAEALGRELAEAVLSCGGDEILEELRYEDAAEPQAP
jgi:hydroxymethylbilane synthase